MNTAHRSPYDRGAADSYYRRPFNPHYWLDNLGAQVVPLERMTVEEIVEYTKGYRDNESDNNFKDWGNDD